MDHSGFGGPPLGAHLWVPLGDSRPRRSLPRLRGIVLKSRRDTGGAGLGSELTSPGRGWQRGCSRDTVTVPALRTLMF